jgi:hypothetical protein
MKSDFPDLLKRLNDAGVEYVLVGGMAAVFHGAEFANSDCDVVMGFDEGNLIRLARALSPLSPILRNRIPQQPFDESFAKTWDFNSLHLDTSAGVLDCLGDIKGLGDFAECRARSLEVDLGGFSIRVLTREALISAKKAMGRPKDLLTVAHLEVGSELEGG